MIVVRLCGGLGNQLFQYATARSLALASKSELVLDLDWYKRTPHKNTLRQYELSHYAIQARLPTREEQMAFRFYAGRILRRLPWKPFRWKQFRERHFDHDAALASLRGEVYLDGYWQSYKYFEHIADLLRSEFTPIEAMSALDEPVRRAISSTNSISVHVRRGDYVSQQAASATHGVCSLDYYDTALKEITLSLARPHFFVFSDDVAWTRTTLAFPGPATFVDHNGPETAFQDLNLMSLCNHHIIANSSFSWWGAWLSSNPQKRVIAPMNWFADGRPTKTLTPPDWLRI